MRPVAVGTLAVVLAATSSGCRLFDIFGAGAARQPHTAWFIGGAIGGGTPVFDGTTAFFISRDHFVTAVDNASGSQRWHVSTGTTGDGPTTSNCAVTAALVACGDSGIVALRRTDGTLAWRFDVTREQPGRFPFQLYNGVIFAGSFGHGTVYAIDATTGTARWTAAVLSTEPMGVNISQLSVDDSLVVGAFIRGTSPQTGGVVALDPQTGAVRWVTPFPKGGPDSTSGAISAALWGNLVLASSQDGKIYLLDRGTGAIQSFFPGVGIGPNIVGVSRPTGEDFRQIVVWDGTLYAGSFSGWFIAYDLQSRKERWRIADPNGSANASPLATDGNAVYIVHANGHLSAAFIDRSRFDWDIGDFHSAFVAAAAVAGNRVFASGITGFWAIDKP